MPSPSTTAQRVDVGSASQRTYLFVSRSLSVYIEGNGSEWKIKKEGLMSEEVEFAKEILGKTYPSLKEAISEAKGVMVRSEYAHRMKSALYSENLIILAGAGCSISAGGKTMEKLWGSIVGESELIEHEALKEAKTNKNLELLLSQLKTISDIDSEKSSAAKELIKKLTKELVGACVLSLPTNSAHQKFIQRITKRKLSLPRAKIFTLNYDLLFEKAAGKTGSIVIDGFSFAFDNIFNGRHFDLDIVYRENTRIKDEESFYQNVFHLYKMHGSINWTRDESDNVKKIEEGQIDKYIADDKICLIYPRDSKYKESFSQPFFEMMSRFHIAMRHQNAFLLIIGYSFQDGHVNAAIEEAISSNTGLEIMVVNSSIKSGAGAPPVRGRMFELAKQSSRFTLIADEFDDFASHIPETKWDTPEEKEQRILKK